MFIIYHSNSLELFVHLIINIMSSYCLNNPLQSEIIIINHKIIEKWIEIKLANHFGIAANIMFMNIESFMKKVFLDILHSDLDIYIFSQDFMFWKFMQILPEVSIKKQCVTLKQYLYDDHHQQKLGQLSEQLVNLFSEYLLYRSDWLDSWGVNRKIDHIDSECQFWQSEIWNMLSQCMQRSSRELNLWNRCINLIQKNTQQDNYKNLPSRIFICGIVSIPPVYWKILNLLSNYIDVYIWYIDPCINSAEYSVHSVFYENNENIAKVLSNNCCSLCNYVDCNHSLLQKWGKTGQDTACLLSQLEKRFTIKAFVIPQQDSMLNILQKDILETELHILNSKKNQFNFIVKHNTNRYLLKSSDHSIIIRICHSKQREIESLHDHLLSMFSNNPKLLPGDVIVMAPNIDDYKSAIYNTFNNIFDRQLPFTISSDTAQYTHPIILAFFKICEISNSRFTSEEVLSLLSVSSIASRFNIDTREMQLLQKWVLESGIRWGIDSNTMYDFDLPITSQNTWEFGLKRMLLGYAINSQTGVWENIFPYDYTGEACISLVSRLEEFLNTLKKWRNCFSLSHTLITWMSYIQDIINDFFDYKNLDLEESKALFLLKTYWINIINTGIQSGYSKVINIIVLTDMLKIKLTQKHINYQFSPSSINFYNITPICCVPCKVLCIIGMSHGAFPRCTSLCNFNLIFKKTRIGDNNIWEKDCYSFLLACLLPKNQLYFSFVKNSDHYTNVADYSSRLISELIEYLAQKFYLTNNLNLDIAANIKCLRKRLFQKHSCMPFDISNFANNLNKTDQSFFKEWLPAAHANINSDVLVDSNFMISLPPIAVTTIEFSELYNFYRHPIRTWFQKRLGVYFPSNTKQLLNHEPFSVENIYRFSLNIKIVDYILHNKNVDTLYNESYASGRLPYGVFGKLFWLKECEQMNKLANRILEYHVPDQVYQFDISLKCDAIKLIGQLNMVQKNGLIRWKPASLSMKDCFLFWLEHLVYCATGGNGDSQFFGINDTWRFPNLSKSKSKQLLCSLISGYHIGMSMPLKLLYRSGGIWINTVFNWRDKMICTTQICQKQARYKLIQTWQGNNNKNFFSSGESQDPYLRKLIPLQLNEENIQKIIGTARDYLLNVMQYRI